MDFATTSSVTVLREIKSGTVSVDELRALALTASKNLVDPNGVATFGEQDATVNPDGSITVTLAVETAVPVPAAITAPAAQAPVTPAPAVAAGAIPLTIAAPQTA